MPGLTLDTGALIAFDRRERRIIAILKDAERRGEDVVVPTIVVAEAWRGGPRSARTSHLLGACIVEPLLEGLARVAGEALARVPGASAPDAVVVASAAQRDDVVVTSDFDDLDDLRSCFPNVRILRVSSPKR
jgi:predicted nucleic acid-binding protein